MGLFYNRKWDEIKNKNLITQVITGRERPVLYQYPDYTIDIIARLEFDMSEDEFLMYVIDLLG